MSDSDDSESRTPCLILAYNYLKNKGKASLIARKATQPPIVSMMAFFTSWSPFCRLDKATPISALRRRVFARLPPNRTYMFPRIRLSFLTALFDTLLNQSITFWTDHKCFPMDCQHYFLRFLLTFKVVEITDLMDD